MRKIPSLIWLAALAAALLCGCSLSQASPPSGAGASVSAPAVSRPAEPAPPPPPPPYVLDRSGIPEEVNGEVATLTSEGPVAYAKVLDDAEEQGDRSNSIDLTAYWLTPAQVRDVTARCTDRKVLWRLNVDGVMVTPDVSELDLSGHDLAGLGVDLYQLFELLPNLTRVDICKTGFTNAEYAALQDTFPDVRMIWEIVWHHWTFRTDVVAFSTMKTCAQTFFLYDEDAQYLRYCTDLVALDLGHNRVHDWSFLQYMPNLKILIAVDNQVKDLSWIKYTPKLEYLEFFVGYVTDLSFLQYTPNLKDLNISYNRVSDATYLYNLPNLERLWMEHTRIPYKDYQNLRKTYPNAKIVRDGEGSIDQGWRKHERYFAMRSMFKNNNVHELFMDKEEQTPG